MCMEMVWVWGMLKVAQGFDSVLYIPSHTQQAEPLGSTYGMEFNYVNSYQPPKDCDPWGQ
jgi:hypothetical protein